MVQIIYSDSIYRFTDPVRYFKANDPYYFEVDNIPIKQLEQNTKWLKDQITNLKISNVTREDIAELRPYVEGTDRKVKVNPGRFIARINDAHGITPLQRITQVLGANAGEFNTWEAAALNNILINDLIIDFKTELLGVAQNECLVPLNSQAFGMNGLIERAMTYPMQSNETPSTILIGTTKGTTASISINKPPYPISEAQLWKGDTVQTSFIIKQYDRLAPTLGFASLGVAETVFVKRWRGVARTAVVDVAETLEIEIPPFDPADFSYTDETGATVVLDSAKWRIDLVFIYSKPVDTTGVTIAKYNADGTATTITKPQLGIVRGAGLGVDFRKSINNTLNDNYPTINAIDVNGVSKILPHVLDQGNNLLGVSGFPGSYPAPDDLMNLTPMLLESLTDGHFALIGQSVLPIAYVVCKKDEATVTAADVIDIRPFFRTAELSYNERAGIAAALPSPSLANPFVTEAYVDLENRKVLDEVNRLISEIPTGGNTTVVNNSIGSGRVVYSSYIKGGRKFGVEGALLTKYASLVGPTRPTESLIEEIVELYGLPGSAGIPDLPDWDVAEWANQIQNLPERGDYPLDRMGFTLFRPTPAMKSSIRGPFLGHRTLSSTILDFPFYQYGHEGGPQGVEVPDNRDIPRYSTHFIKKTIRLNREDVPWMKDYDVDVQYWNCFPIDKGKIWVDKRFDRFTIFIEIPAPRVYERFENGSNITAGYGPGDGITLRPDNTSFNRDTGIRSVTGGTTSGRRWDPITRSWINLAQGSVFSTDYSIYPLFGVLTEDLVSETRRQNAIQSAGHLNKTYWQPEGETPSFSALYPTVTFKVIGYSRDDFNYNLSETEPIITLNG